MSSVTLHPLCRAACSCSADAFSDAPRPSRGTVRKTWTLVQVRGSPSPTGKPCDRRTAALQALTAPTATVTQHPARDPACGDALVQRAGLRFDDRRGHLCCGGGRAFDVLPLLRLEGAPPHRTRSCDRTRRLFGGRRMGGRRVRRPCSARVHRRARPPDGGHSEVARRAGDAPGVGSECHIATRTRRTTSCSTTSSPASCGTVSSVARSEPTWTRERSVRRLRG